MVLVPPGYCLLLAWENESEAGSMVEPIGRLPIEASDSETLAFSVYLSM